jgi:ABC-type glycerol-3-phosphate transport system substrate-binding protein
MLRHLRFSLKATLLLLAISLVALSAACQRATPSPTPTTAVLPDTTNQEQIELTFAGYASQRSLFEPLIGEFYRQHPDIVVKFVEPVSSSNNYQLQQLAAADIAIITGQEIPQAGAYFHDLQPLIDADPTFEPDDFWPGLLGSIKSEEGRSICIPLTVGIHGIYFDKKAFTTAGLSAPRIGWTWEEFRNAVQGLALPQESIPRYGFADDNGLYTSLLGPLINSYLVENDGRIDARSLQTRLQWYFDLANAKALYGMQDAGIGIQTRQTLFQSGAPPAMWTGYLAAALPGIEPHGNSWENMAISDYGFTPFPVEKNTDHTTPTWIDCVAIGYSTRHTQAAWAWVNFLSRQWVTLQEAGAYGIARAPARRSVAEKVNYWNKLPEKVVLAVRFGMEHAWIGPRYPLQFSLVNLALSQVISDKADLATALAVAEAAIEAQKAVTSEPTPGTVELSVATPPLREAPAEVSINYAVTYAMEKLSSDKHQHEMKILVEEYNHTHPENMVNVTQRYLSNDIYGSDSGNPVPADCFAYVGLPVEWSMRELLVLDTFLDTEVPTFMQDYPLALLDAFRINGKLYGIPAAVQPPVMFYNIDLLSKRGRLVPANDWTFEDFISMVMGATSTEESDKSYGYVLEWFDVPFFLAGRGVVWMDLASFPPLPRLDSPEMVSALAWLVEFHEAGVIVYHPMDWDYLQIQDEPGKVAFWQGCAGNESSGNCGWIRGTFLESMFGTAMIGGRAASQVDPSEYQTT